MCDLSIKIFQPEKHIYNGKYLIVWQTQVDLSKFLILKYSKFPWSKFVENWFGEAVHRTIFAFNILICLKYIW